jgi:acyl carrier protein
MAFEIIKKIIAEQLKVDESIITMDTHLMKDLEADSIDAVEIIILIEEKYGIEIPDEDAEKFQRVGDLVRYVEGRVK